MIRFLFIALCALFVVPSFGQQTIYDTIVHNSLNRSYILYVPSSYDSTQATPLVFNFHGYTSSAEAQMYYGDFRGIADTAGFIIVHPMGTKDNTNTTHWNVGWGTSSIDDIGFVNALLDTLESQYNIDSQRVYSTGMSNGGFMSLLLACELSDRIAAVASVTGSMTSPKLGACNPSHPTGVMQIHGTSDGTVPYGGDGSWTVPVSSVVNFWVQYNNTDPMIDLPLPNISLTDGSTVTHQIFKNGDSCVNVEHYKITGGGHTWPGTAFGGAGTNYDFNASQVIWDFFALHHRTNGRAFCDTTSVPDTTGISAYGATSVSVYPNPAFDEIHVSSPNFRQTGYKIMDLTGKCLRTGVLRSGNNVLSVSDLENGIYFLQVSDPTGLYVCQFVKH